MGSAVLPVRRSVPAGRNVAGTSEGILFGRYARLVGAPNCAPSLRSVAGLLLALALESACEDTLTSLYRSVTAALLRAAGVGGSVRSLSAVRPRGEHGNAELRSARSRAEVRRRPGDERESRARRERNALVRVALRGKVDRVLVGRFAKRARGGDPRPSRARERC